MGRGGEAGPGSLLRGQSVHGCAGLIEAFQKRYPQYERIYVETLPPGILAEQIEQGGLVVGNLRISLKPDVFTAGKDEIENLQKEKGWFDQTRAYARNRLAIMVRAGNPKGIESLEDLGRPGVRVRCPTRGGRA